MYLVSIALCMLGCIVAATAKTISVLIGMRCLQAAGYPSNLRVQSFSTHVALCVRSSAVMSIGAATLADLYEPSERGTMMGIYYWYAVPIYSFRNLVLIYTSPSLPFLPSVPLAHTAHLCWVPH